MKFRLRLTSIIGLLSAAAMTLMLSCNQIQNVAPKHEVEMAPSIQSEEQQENKKGPLATGGDLVMEQSYVFAPRV
jgi:hypothetical protein